MYKTHSSALPRFIFALCLLMHCAISPLRAEVFRILDHEQDALQCRIDLIARAQGELLLSTYIIKEDDVGLGVLQLLLQAAARGVRVKVILDSFGREVSPALLNFLTAHGVEVRLFNRTKILKFHTFRNRMHGKMLIADTEHLIVGGRNLTEEYFELDSIGNFLDREVYTNSREAAADVRLHFFAMWNNRKLTSKEDAMVLSAKKHVYWLERLQKAWATLQTRRAVLENSPTNWAQGKALTAPVHATYDYFVEDTISELEPFDVKDCRASEQLVALIDSAKTSIDIENPYFHPTPSWEAAFKRAVQRGVRLRLFTNSECTNDVPLMQAVYRRIRPKYLRLGFQIWEYEGSKRVHTKAFVIDNAVVVVGSYNIHSISEKNNTEVCLWVRDTAIATQCRNIMDRHLAEARAIHNTPAYFKCSQGSRNPKCGCRSDIVNFFICTLAPLLAWTM